MTNLSTRHSFGLILFLTILLMLLAGVTGSSYGTESYNNKRLLFIGLSGISVLILLGSRKLNLKSAESSARYWPLYLCLLILCTLGVFVCATSPEPLRALADFCHHVSMVVMIWFLANQLHEGEMPLILDACVYLVCFYGVLLLLDSIFKVAFWEDGTTLMKPMFGFIHPRFCNQVFSSLAPVVLYAFLFGTEGKRRLPGIAMFFVFFVIFISEGRGFLLSFTLVGVWLIALSGRDRLGNGFKLLLIGIAAFLLVLFLWQLYSYAGGSGSQFSHLTSQSSSGRLSRLWPIAIEQTIQNPWWGIGARNSFIVIGFETHAHNSTLQLTMEYGLIFCGVLAMSIGVYLYFLKGFLQQIVREQSLGLAFLSAIFCAAIYSQFSGVYATPASQIFVVFMLGVFLALYRYYASAQLVINVRSVQKNWQILIVCVARFLLLTLTLLGVILLVLEYYFIVDNDIFREMNHPRVWVYDY